MDVKQKFLLGFIILVIAGILLLVFFEEVKNFGVGESNKEICKRQVEIHATSPTLQASINCPITNVTLKSDPNADGTKRRIADLMKDVRDIYSIAWEGSELFEVGSGVFCAVYAIVDFTQKEGKIENFEKFLAEKRHSALSEQSYMDYFANARAGFSSNLISRLGYSEMPAKDRYAVLFWYKKEYSGMDAALNQLGNAISGRSPQAKATGRIAAVGGGAVIGAAGVMLMASGVGIPAGIILLGIGAGGAVLGGATTGVFINRYTEEPRVAAQVLFTRYNTAEDLQAIECENFPIALGTRPQ